MLRRSALSRGVNSSSFGRIGLERSGQHVELGVDVVGEIDQERFGRVRSDGRAPLGQVLMRRR